MGPWRLHLSWLVLAVVGLLGALFARGVPNGIPVSTALTAGYVGWSLYWGLPPFLRWWRKTWFNLSSLAGCFSTGCLVQGFLAMGILVLGGYSFSILGGGLFHYWRFWKAANFQS